MNEIAAIERSASGLTLPLGANGLPALPWRDPQSVPPEELARFIAALQEACAQNPENADMRTCLGIAHAMNYEVYESMDALEEARGIAPENFFAQLKYAELLSRLRVVDRAEKETLRALELARDGWELSVARRQLAEIRKSRRKGLVRPEWTKSVKASAMALAALMCGIGCAYLVWR